MMNKKVKTALIFSGGILTGTAIGAGLTIRSAIKSEFFRRAIANAIVDKIVSRIFGSSDVDKIVSRIFDGSDEEKATNRRFSYRSYCKEK